MSSRNFVMSEYKKGRFQVMRAYWGRLQRDPHEIRELEHEAAADGAPYDALWRKEDGSWATLHQDVAHEAGRALRTELDNQIAYEAQKAADGVPF